MCGDQVRCLDKTIVVSWTTLLQHDRLIGDIRPIYHVITVMVPIIDKADYSAVTENGKFEC